MIRSLLILLAITTLIVLTIGMVGDPGLASLSWMNYRIDIPATAAVIIIGVMAFCAVAFWNLALWLARSPQRAERARADQRRRQGDDALTRGFMAVAVGDGSEARRHAVKALDLSDNTVLVRILGAMAAEESGDAVATRTAYSAMVSVPELKLAGLRGLMQLAARQGDKAEAVKLAGEAYNQPRPSMWAFETLFAARLEAGEWAEALDLIEGALTRKLISPIFSERAKASLMAASAARLETSDDAQMRDQALDYAQRAAKLQPQFTPAAIIAARLLAKANKPGRAEDVLEAAWASRPHPAVWLAYRDLVSDETPKERARRLQGLVDRNAKHRESRLLQVERALLTNTKAEIAAALAALEEDSAEANLTKRICGVIARGAQGLGDYDTARVWIAKAASARGEADWSDIDAEGKAFAYSAADWSDVILNFAETAALSHPRYERGDKGLPEIPDMPPRYVPSMPFIKGPARRGSVRTDPSHMPDDVGQYDAAITGQDLDEPVDDAKPKAARGRAKTPKK
ncbi:hemY protein [Asticcacaulis biprosthecium C19]|uniref:HemY protein n=1 Tax=Asticcacaulis biprosthecium C19 TaxID=715226 RepID=F4QI46_9CAUL|nr:heme biosynthesis HemY N-terminal domain-containing protein [Asticcacaulis biprosthecium]EGF92913.1 hemY protein [Asticcacaulis biprosthecium C19]